ncbi:carbohydrate ABC transporter permease [Candidatus Epulonipiscium viviparus]|uniref:carbohydrate ABC transporter permease n=1 Tax=Candidatus Epulonipiscium viviparus TaxID=420336 RepID=UPI0005C53C0B|nr:carbohydrate ABC transporter permease [Candidatus Epulopiscium viviparus]
MNSFSSIFKKGLSFEDRVFVFMVYFIMLCAAVVAIYPLIYVVSASFSSPDAVSNGQVIFLPVDFSLEAYKAVFEYKDIWSGYANTIFIAITGTVLNVFLTLMIAYPISRKSLFGRKQITFLLTFTMMFSAGMIPTYLLMQNLGLVGSRMAVIILGLLPVRNVILARTFYMQTIGSELIEAAKIDGATEYKIMWQIIMPLSKSILAVIALFTFVDYWNEFFNSLIYLNDSSKYPLQLVLREILTLNTIDPSVMPLDPETMNAVQGMSELLKYAIIVVSSVPVMCLFPFAQKYFVRGVMTGAVKG